MITDFGYNYQLSTNGSIFKKIPSHQVKNGKLIISMPGFSQESYDKIHGFIFPKILENIDLFIKNFGSENVTISYHIYQFNVDEAFKAIRFFSRQGVFVSHSFAYMVDYRLVSDFLLNNLNNPLFSNINTHLFLHYVNNLISICPASYSCPQWNSLIFDDKGRIVTCCGIPKDSPIYELISTTEMPLDCINFEYLYKKRSESAFCKSCLQSGLPYWAHNPQTLNSLTEYQKKLKPLRVINNILNKCSNQFKF